MSYTTILAAIKSDLQAVSGVQNVHDYIRYKKDETEQKQIAIPGYVEGAPDQIIHMWEITRTATEIQDDSTFQDQDYTEHVFKLIGFYGIRDADLSEKTFQQLGDDICNSFNNKANLQPTAQSYRLKGVFIEEFVNVMDAPFKGALCHRMTINLRVSEDVNL